jgi:hypothetical protein
MKPNAMNSQPNPETCWTRGAWLTVLAAGVFIVFNLAHVAYRFNLPSLGWVVLDPAEVESNGQFRLVTNAVGAPSTLQPGDVVMRLGEVNVGTYDALGSELLPRPARWRVGERIAVAVERQGRALVIEASVVQWTWSAWWRTNFLDLRRLWEWVMTALLLGAGGYVFTHRPGNLAARFLFAFGVAQLSIVLSNTPQDYLALLTDAPAAFSKTLFGNIIFAYLLGPSFWGFAFTFPRPKLWVQRQPRWLLVPFLIGAITIVLLAFAPTYAIIGFPLTMAMLVGGLGALLHSGLTQRDAISRAQLRWAIGGVSIGVGLFLLNFLLFSGQPLYRDLLSALASLGFPIIALSLAIAIFRHRLFDIDILIRRTLQYSLLSGLLGLTYFGLITILQGAFRALSGQQSEISIVLSILAIAALFFPLRNRVQEFIDKRFYRQKYDAQKVLAGFAATCRDETDIEMLTARLVGVIEEALQPETVSVWLKPVDDERRTPAKAER